MKKRKIFIYASGSLNESDIVHITGAEFVIGVDKAAYWLVKNGKKPDVAIGDFDSVTKGEFVVINNNVRRTYTYPTTKNSTDTELAVQYALTLRPAEIVLFGCFGARQDHALATVQLLSTCLAAGVPAYLRDDTNEVSLENSRRTIYKRQGFHYASFLAYTKSVTFSLSGFLYPAVQKTIKQGETIGVSNELAGKSGVITVHDGIAIVALSSDADGG